MTAADNLRAFDPNSPQNAPWATWVGGRFKLHKLRGGALTRYGNGDYAILYRMGDDGLWKEVIRKCREDENHKCSICGADTLMPSGQMAAHGVHRWGGRGMQRTSETNQNGEPIWDTGRYGFVRRNGKIVHPLIQEFACMSCYVNVL